MFRYDPDYTESDWRHEADARELAELDADRRDMQEYPPPPLQLRLNPIEEKCCENPTSFHLAPSFEPDYETGYDAPIYFRCDGCGNLICEEDYAAIVEWSERQSRPVPAIPAKTKEAA